jgi:hypothetical protein
VSENPARRANELRAELDSTLSEIDRRLDLRLQGAELSRRVRAGYERNPVPYLLGAAVATAVVVGLVAWAIVGDD